MTYSLEFDRRALKEWQKLGDTVRSQFKKKLAEVLENPRIEANRLRELPDCYKLKLRSAGYRLINTSGRSQSNHLLRCLDKLDHRSFQHMDGRSGGIVI